MNRFPCRYEGRQNILHDVVANLCRRSHLSVRVEKGHGLTKDDDHSRPDNMCSLQGGIEAKRLYPTLQ